MKQTVLQIIEDYLKVFPKEKERLQILISYLQNEDYKSICDWNNVKGHITAGAFIYSPKDDKFLMLYHKELKMYLYLGGHAEFGEENPLTTAKKEVIEETGISNTNPLVLNNNPLIPLDIDIHVIPENLKYNMPSHYHYDFRYLFIINEKVNINLDLEELRNYKWISFDEFKKNNEFIEVVEKIKKILKKN